VTAPYYSDGRVTLYHGDCLEIDAWLKADVLVTDPPYGMAYRGNHRLRHERLEPIAGDDSLLARDTALGLWGNRPAAVFGTWKRPRPGGHIHALLVWDKTDGVGPGMGDIMSVFGSSHEEIYILGRRWPRANGKRMGSVLRTSVAPTNYTEKIGHPTPKPVGLMERIIEVSPPGVISDPFAGSGSTLVAARNLGRTAIGVEIDERYCELVAKRLDQMCLDFSARMFCGSMFLGAHCQQPAGHPGNHGDTHSSGYNTLWTDTAADEAAS
jgi:DNA modification methylase